MERCSTEVDHAADIFLVFVYNVVIVIVIVYNFVIVFVGRLGNFVDSFVFGGFGVGMYLSDNFVHSLDCHAYNFDSYVYFVESFVYFRSVFVVNFENVSGKVVVHKHHHNLAFPLASGLVKYTTVPDVNLRKAFVHIFIKSGK